jgi:arylsulfatase A-like enzyme
MRMIGFLALLALGLAFPAAAAESTRPNVVIIFCDDLGYADLGCFGAKEWKTPHLDELAKNGVRFTDFTVPHPVCSASRAALLTGCYSPRVGIHGALGPVNRIGLSEKETTLAEICRSRDYATAIVGKWHLGHLDPFLPTRHGFDQYYGLPYSNDMWPHHPATKTFPALPLIRNTEVINKDVTPEDQANLTRNYTQESVKFITHHAGKKPFFLYLAHSMPHVPIFASKKYRGSSPQGLYGDVIQEIDGSVGEIVKTLKEHKALDNTLIIFTSDNGPWLSYGNHGGRKEPLREGKGSVWEGGVRVPMIAHWPAALPKGTVQSTPAMTIDLLPTIAGILGAKLPDHPIDGKDILPLLKCTPGAKSPHSAYYFYYGTGELQAMRSGKWKLIFPHKCRMIEDREPGKDGKPAGYKQVPLELMLFDLESDVGEKFDVASKYPEVVKQLQELADTQRALLGDSLTKKVGSGNRPVGQVPMEKK